VPEDVRFAAIWSNPPVRIGKPALHDVLQRWLGRLSDDGRALLVVQKHLGADSLHRWLEQQGWRVTRRASRMAYRVLEVRH
jgi:16S rRNA (guanine1207-N2)-methyltransferase